MPLSHSWIASLHRCMPSHVLWSTTKSSAYLIQYVRGRPRPLWGRRMTWWRDPHATGPPGPPPPGKRQAHGRRNMEEASAMRKPPQGAMEARVSSEQHAEAPTVARQVAAVRERVAA